jgi:ATP-dependent Clp protease ATP-binding subunit ClpA
VNIISADFMFQASIVSRVQGVLPFLPFTHDEQRALASEMLDKLISQYDDSAEAPNTCFTTAVANDIVGRAIQDYIEREGARSIHRAVQELCEEKLMDM